MVEIELLIAQMDFCRGRTLDLLEKIEAHEADTQEILSWRPGPGRAHIAWQLMHLAASDDRHLNQRLQQLEVKDPKLAEQFAGGSTPNDDNIPTPEAIRSALKTYRDPLVAHFRALDDSQLDNKPFPDALRSYRASSQLLAWHEAHHHGQAHFTFNLFNARQ